MLIKYAKQVSNLLKKKTMVHESFSSRTKTRRLFVLILLVTFAVGHGVVDRKVSSFLTAFSQMLRLQEIEKLDELNKVLD